MLHGRGNSKDQFFILEAEGKPVLVQKETVGEFTGRNDSFNVKIFEGDNLEYTRPHNRGKDTGVVQWNKDLAQFVVKNENALLHKDFHELRYMTPLRVTGNIYGL